MPFFQAEVNEETFYFKAHTWMAARDMARRLWPLEVFEDNWKQMKMSDEGPAKESNPTVFEFDFENREVVLAEGYKYDTVKRAKGKKGSR